MYVIYVKPITLLQAVIYVISQCLFIASHMYVRYDKYCLPSYFFYALSTRVITALNSPYKLEIFTIWFPLFIYLNLCLFAYPWRKYSGVTIYPFKADKTCWVFYKKHFI